MTDVKLHFAFNRLDDRSDKLPLLLLHGFTGQGENWNDIRAGLPLPTLTIDFPGHGRSEVPAAPEDYQMEPTAERIIQIVRQYGRVHLLGYSMGGRMALYLACHYPGDFAKIILESTSPGLATAAERAARRSRDADLAERIERDGVEAFVDFWENIPLFASQKRLPAGVQAYHRALRLQNNRVGLANSLRGMGTGSQPSLWDALGEVGSDALLIAGELDAKYVTINQRMAERLPNARLEVVSDAGHTVHLEQPTRYTELITEFLKE